MELALDFEAYAGRQLPPAPQSRFVGGEMPLQEKARVLKAHHLTHGAIHRTGHYPAGQDDQSLQNPNPHGSKAGHGIGGAPPLHQAAESLTPPAPAPDVWGGEMGAETTSQAGAEESQTQQGAGRQATAQSRGSDGQEAMPGKRRGQALCDAPWH